MLSYDPPPNHQFTEALLKHPGFEITNPGIMGEVLSDALNAAESAALQDQIFYSYYIQPDSGLSLEQEAQFDQQAEVLSPSRRRVYEKMKHHPLEDLIHKDLFLSEQETSPLVNVAISKPLSQGTNIGEIRFTNTETSENAIITLQFHLQSDPDAHAQFQNEFNEIATHLRFLADQNPAFLNWLIHRSQDSEDKRILTIDIGKEAYRSFDYDSLSDQERISQSVDAETQLIPRTAREN